MKNKLDTFSSTQLIIKSAGTGPPNWCPDQGGDRCHCEGRHWSRGRHRERGLRKFYNTWFPHLHEDNVEGSLESVVISLQSSTG